MAVIDVAQFGGVAPRVPARVLGAGGAQVNDNLLATAVEFRPLQEDVVVSARDEYAGGRTLYRLSRQADGTYREGDGEGWIVTEALRSYARGDLHDDATERTYYTDDEGLHPPRVMDAKGNDRLLGVPAPRVVTVALDEVSQFTMDEALGWVAETLMPALVEAVKASLVDAHVWNGKPAAGADEMYCMTAWADDSRYGVASKTFDQCYALRDPGLAGFEYQGKWVVPLKCLPKWGMLDQAALVTRLRAIPVPKAGEVGATVMLSEESAQALAQAFAPAFDPKGSQLANARQQMTTCVKDFCETFSANFGSAPDNGIKRPERPVKPTTMARYYGHLGADGGGSYPWPAYREKVRAQYPVAQYPQVTDYIIEGDRNASWNNSTVDFEHWNYNWLNDHYDAMLAEYEAKKQALAEDWQPRVTRLKELQITAANLHDQIFGEYQRRLTNLKETLTNAVNNLALLGEGGMIAVDPPRVLDTRFYVVTHVTDWGWESKPSPVSEMIEADQNDAVTVKIPRPPADRQITQWRVYRSNVGSQQAAYQFVAQVLVADSLTFRDATPSKDLGEVCATFGWDEPPYRPDNNSAQEVKPPKGEDPYPRGLVAMPNGVLAAFVDNFVAFCDPYHPYAWPVEYQITTESPIVGLGVFGQSLFVGTRAHPYVISGADSASMSAVKLPQYLPCVSARSIVGVGDGVVYASDEGLVMVSSAGAQVITQALFSREDWQDIDPESIVAAEYGGVVYFRDGSGTVWALDFAAKKLTTVDMPEVAAMRRDELTGGLFVLSAAQWRDYVDGAWIMRTGLAVRRCFEGGPREATWQSGVLTLPKPAAMAWAVVVGENLGEYPATFEWQGGSGRGAFDADITGFVRKVQDCTPFRLPPGRPLEHVVKITSRARITRVQLASSVAELQGI